MVVIMGARGTTTATSICKHCGEPIEEWTPEYWCQIHQTDQPIWLHNHEQGGASIFCQTTVAQPLEES